ncbi:hypothetical protein ACFW5W_28485 [Streptomyces sp. NPDC058783]|uniref:hypothetical protein n=1 Tax=Streptomyces sp. NPDC058783 TaxID=3346633 RepID=UPI00368EB7CF
MNQSDGSLLTACERAFRARLAWQMYRSVHGGEVRDLIADLMYLADVDRHPGGGANAAREAVCSYANEQLRPEPVPFYLGQYRPTGQDWITVAEGGTDVERADVAGCLWHVLQRADMHTGEIPAHVQDLARGRVLVADDGTAFRVIENPAHTG